MHRRYIDPRRSFQGSPRNRSAYQDEEDDEEDVEIKLSPSGSVLMASPNPYDKTQRIREANTQLKQIKMPPQKPGKVRFNEKVILYSEDYSSEPRSSKGFQQNQNSPTPMRQGQNKILLVTVPTGFSEDNDEGPMSDEGEEVFDETGFRWDRCSKEHETASVINEEEIVHEIVETEQPDDLVTEELKEPILEEGMQSEVKNLCSEMSTKCLLDVKEEINEPMPITDINEVKEKIKSVKEEQNSVEKVEKKQETKNEARPKSVSAKRLCLSEVYSSPQASKLPSYNGLRSEYGLSAEQLIERKKKKIEMSKLLRKEREERYIEEKRRQKENDQMFASWLVKKKKEAALKYARKRQQNSYYFKTLPAPTSHLDKMGVLRKKVLSKKEHTCYSLEEFFKHAKPHEQKTYRIYLGLCVE
ncbi:stress response protein NST1-like [Cimex lectularius]|uniref:Coiled-coil domain-containing protein 181 n=1 Tax=Cimex lectularius TaxID=79782 RepID=A0A8I6SE81_CIMLE|nr:stress response protein NST1-like [Cimex lectularius]